MSHTPVKKYPNPDRPEIKFPDPTRPENILKNVPRPGPVRSGETRGFGLPRRFLVNTTYIPAKYPSKVIIIQSQPRKSIQWSCSMLKQNIKYNHITLHHLGLLSWIIINSYLQFKGWLHEACIKGFLKPCKKKILFYHPDIQTPSVVTELTQLRLPSH